MYKVIFIKVILIYVHSRVLNDFTGSSESCESIIIKENVPDCWKIKIFGIYRPPINFLNEFIYYF